MRILILSDANSSHTIKWVNSLKEVNGITVGLWSLQVPKKDIYIEGTNLKLSSAGIQQHRKGLLKKLKYITSIFDLLKFIRNFKPDVIHAHYATSYGLLGRLTNFHPFVISVWGSDVFKFPRKNFISKRILQKNLNSADLVLSTSYVMKEEANNYTKNEIVVTPFGIDTNVFKPEPRYKQEDFIIGTVKTLEKIYGIEYLISAFKVFKDRNPHIACSLIIVGGGSQYEALNEITHQLNISDCVKFIGPIPPEEVPKYHNMMDVSVFLSLEESFGVAILEAMATERPVVVSDAVGLTEIVEHHFNGIIVQKGNAESAALAIEKLYYDEDLRSKLGINGRKTVQQKYEWENNVVQMKELYTSLLQKLR